jgi:hypothetical protein
MMRLTGGLAACFSLAEVIVERNKVMANLKDVLIATGHIPDNLAEMERQTKSVLNKIYRHLKFIPSSRPLEWKGKLCMMVAKTFGLHSEKFSMDDSRKDWWDNFCKELRIKHNRKRNNVGNEVKKRSNVSWLGFGKGVYNIELTLQFVFYNYCRFGC